MTVRSLSTRQRPMLRRAAPWFGIAALWAFSIGLAWLLGFHSRFGMLDFRAYYDGAQRLVHGEILYRGFVGNIYIYPPLLAQLLIPFTALSWEAATSLWFILNVLLLITVTALLGRVSEQGKFWWIVAPVFVALMDALQIGQVTIIILTLLLGVWLAVRTDRRVLTGALLALATWIKIYPVLIILYFAWKRDWRVVRGALIAGIVLAFVQIAISGIDTFLDMLTTLFSLASYGEYNLFAKNASVNGFATQLFGSVPLVQPLIISPLLSLLTRAVVSLALVFAAAWAISRNSCDSRSFDLEFGLVIVTMLLLSPTLYTSGMPPLLLVYFLLLRCEPTKAMRWLVIGACVILSLYWLFVTGYSGDPPISGLLLSFGFYVLMATWGVNFILLRRHQTVAQREVLLAGETGS